VGTSLTMENNRTVFYQTFRTLYLQGCVDLASYEPSFLPKREPLIYIYQNMLDIYLTYFEFNKTNQYIATTNKLVCL